MILYIFCEGELRTLTESAKGKGMGFKRVFDIGTMFVNCGPTLFSVLPEPLV